MAAISIHAELLLNIRQITVQASLPTDCNATTSVRLSSERSLLSAFHDGQVAEIRLPAAVREGSIPRIDPKSVREVSLRLPVAKGTVDQVCSAGPTTWSASSMASSTRLSCRACHVFLVKDSVRLWKDLPSENWAEMMDFWHCHKPDTDETLSHHQNGLRKGYGAATTIQSTAGVGLVDAMYLLLSLDDVHVVLDEESTKLKARDSQRIVLCASCKHPVGVAADADSARIRLYKWEIRLAPKEGSAWQEYPADKFVSAQILAMIESQGVQRFVIHDGRREEYDRSLLVWIFNTNIIYSSTSVPESPRRAMKVYYKIISDPTKALEQEGFKADELQLPDGALQSLQSALESANRILPVSAQRFQDWSVGLVAR
ncbi:MAG: hypothetical protein Q9216_003196 [Gyalolechia sp. 2 TL-2023]